MTFKDRQAAGQKLIPRLKQYQNNPQAVILALPRGGVVTAEPIARELKLPLDLVIPRKIGSPENPEYAIGAITEQGIAVFDPDEEKRVDRAWLKKAIDLETKEAKRRRETYLQGRKPIELSGKTAIIVDDGIATGLTMAAAVAAVKRRRPARIIIAVPNSSRDAAAKLSGQVDEFISLATPATYDAVGQFYQHFEQTKDQEVIDIMKSINE